MSRYARAHMYVCICIFVCVYDIGYMCMCIMYVYMCVGMCAQKTNVAFSSAEIKLDTPTAANENVDCTKHYTQK